MSGDPSNQKLEIDGQRTEPGGQTPGVSGDLNPPRVFISYSHDTPAHKKWWASRRPSLWTREWT